MISMIQNKLGVTAKGARGMLKAAVLTFFVNVSYLLPMMIIFYFVDSLLTKGVPATSEIYYYIGAILISGIILFIFNWLSYNSLYVATYGESADLRIELANTLKDCVLSDSGACSLCSYCFEHCFFAIYKKDASIWYIFISQET